MRQCQAVSVHRVLIVIAGGRWRGGLDRPVPKDGQVPGKILMVRDSAAWMWQGGDLHELYGDGNLSDPRWSPDGDQILYVATQDTYSDLVLLDIDTGVTEQLTDNAPPLDLEPGSQLYVNRSSWALDPFWSESGRIAFIVGLRRVRPDGALADGVDLGPDAVLAPEDGANRSRHRRRVPVRKRSACCLLRQVIRWGELLHDRRPS